MNSEEEGGVAKVIEALSEIKSLSAISLSQNMMQTPEVSSLVKALKVHTNLV